MNPCVYGGYDCEPRNDTNLRSGTVLDENQVSTLRARNQHRQSRGGDLLFREERLTGASCWDQGTAVAGMPESGAPAAMLDRVIAVDLSRRLP